MNVPADFVVNTSIFFTALCPPVSREGTVDLRKPRKATALSMAG